MEGPRLAAGAARAEAGTTVPVPLPPDGESARAGTVIRTPAPVPTRAPRPPTAGEAAGASSLPVPIGAGGVREEPGASFPGAKPRRRGSPAPNRGDRAGVTYGAITCLSYVRTDKGRRAVWRCRCECGRPGCLGEVERNVEQLRRTWASCRWPSPKPPAVAKARAPSARMLLPEGVRQPWSRTAGKRADRDARLMHAFAKADLR